MKYEKLGNIADLINNRVNNFDGFKKYVDTGSIIDNEIKEFSLVDYSNKPSRADLVVPELSVLFARMKSTVKVLIADRDLQDNYIFSTGFAVLKPKSTLNPFYLAHYLKTNFFNNIKDKLCTGATQKAIRNSEIENIKIPLPPLSEQKQIVEILDKADSIRQKRKQAINLLDEYLRSTFLEIFGEFKENQFCWKISKLGDVLTRKGSIICGPFGSQLKIKEYIENGIPVYGIDNVAKFEFIQAKSKFVSENKYIYLKYFNVDTNDILVTRTGTVGRACLAPLNIEKAIIGPNLLKIKTDIKYLLPEFICYCLNYSDYVKKQIKIFSPGATVAVYNTKNLKNLNFPIPPLEIQQKFVKIIHKYVSIKSKMQESLKEMNNHFNSLLNKFFNN